MTIDDLNNKLARKFRGTSLDDVQGIDNFSIHAEAAGNVLSQLDPMETVRYMRFNQFKGVYDYEPAVDLKGKKLIDPRPQDQRNGRDFDQTFTKEFDRDKEFNNGKVSVEYVDGNKVIRLNDSGKGSARVDNTSDITGWSAAGGATGLEIDSVIRMDNSDTLRFDLGAIGGYVQNSTLTPIDLSGHEDISSFFRKIYLPAGAELVTDVSILIGSAVGSYWTIPGIPQFGEMKEGVNIVRFDWYDAVETLVPDSTNTTFERLIFVTTGAINDVRVGPLDSKLPTPYEIPYYSSCLFRDADTGEWLEEPNSVENEIMLEMAAFNIFFYECCALIAEDLTLDDEAVKFKFKLNGDPAKKGDNGGLYGQYMRDKPEEALRPHTRYITLRSRRGARGLRRRR